MRDWAVWVVGRGLERGYWGKDMGLRWEDPN